MAGPQSSHYVEVLYSAGFVATRRIGRRNRYHVAEFERMCQKLMEREVAEMSGGFTSYSLHRDIYDLQETNETRIVWITYWLWPTRKRVDGSIPGLAHLAMSIWPLRAGLDD